MFLPIAEIRLRRLGAAPTPQQGESLPECEEQLTQGHPKSLAFLEQADHRTWPFYPHVKFVAGKKAAWGFSLLGKLGVISKIGIWKEEQELISPLIFFFFTLGSISSVIVLL